MIDRRDRQKAIDVCIEMLSESSVHIRRTAVWELGQLGDHRAAAHIVAMLDDTDWETRHYAVMALGRLGSADAVPVLQELLDGDYLTADHQGPSGPAPADLAAHIRQDIEYAIAWASGAKAFHEFD